MRLTAKLTMLMAVLAVSACTNANRFDNGAVVHPGDEVLVHGAPVMAPYGVVVVERRTATITRATWFERLWTRLTGDLEFMELCEFSFSEEVKL